MQRIASSRGLELVLLDHTRPLIDQGDYDAIVHKLRPNKGTFQVSSLQSSLTVGLM